MPSTELTEAILKAAENLGTDERGTMGVIGYLEFLRVREPALFEIVMARVQQKDPTPCSQNK